MLSSDHPALSFENFWFSCVLFCFLFSPISTNVFSVAGDRHFHHGMDQKLAVSTSPMHGLHRNTAFNCGRKPKEIIRNTKALNQLDYLIVPLVSFGVLWFPLVWAGWILWFSFGFLRISSVSFGLDSMVFVWFPSVFFGFLWFGFYGFPLVSFGFQGKDKPTKESPRRLYAHRMHQSCL